jgi:C-terminal processing protease CtpA/Prc
LGEFVLLHDQEFISVNVGNHHGNPIRVGIIVDRYVGSAAEQFLLVARQSRKVKIFGEPTAGVLDFSNMNFVESPCGDFVLFYAMSKAVGIDRFPIDGIGIQPDFFLDSSIPGYKWVDVVNEILNHK